MFGCFSFGDMSARSCVDVNLRCPEVGSLASFWSLETGANQTPAGLPSRHSLDAFALTLIKCISFYKQNTHMSWGKGTKQRVNAM